MASLRLRKKSVRRTRLRLENLEDRAVPAAIVGFDPVAGRLTIAGDDANNVARVEVNAGFVRLTVDGQTSSSNPKAANYAPELAGATGATLTAIEFDGGTGRDRLVLGNLPVAGGLTVTGDDEVEVAGKLVAGGPVAVAADDRILVNPGAAVRSRAGADGGSVSLTAPVVILGGRVQADGTHGGEVRVTSTNLLNFGITSADGTAGGGTVELRAFGRYLETTGAVVRANGGAGDGGRIAIDAETMFASGRHLANGRVGGTIDVFGKDVRLIGAVVDASGTAGGGAIRVGGDFQGSNPEIPNAESTMVGGGTVLRADAWRSGSGGRVIVWADGTTEFHGHVSARGHSAGGFIEVSGKGDLTFGGTADAGASKGPNGTLLLDPKNLLINSASGLPQFEILDPTPDAEFGSTLTMLPNGNVVVGDPGDDFTDTDAGAVYLFNATSGALISTLVGRAAGDAIGGSVRVLPVNDNFVILSPQVDESSFYVNVGAATWGSKSVGVSGIVSTSNSLLGFYSNDSIGLTFQALTNGNFVVGAYYADLSSSMPDAGIVCFRSGTTPTSGYAQFGTRIAGSSPNDYVGSGGVTALANGNYAVNSSYWDNSGTLDAGAVTWGNGTVGTNATVSAANSVVGTTNYDNVGSGGVTALTNGNYVVASPYWDESATFVDTGAARLCLGNGTTTGPVLTSNSLTGFYSNDFIGYNGVKALSNGNYVVVSPYADRSGLTDVGAVTWGNGTTGITGLSGTGNSLMGTTASDVVGSGGVTTQTNGHYVVVSPNWDNGATANVGAVTWASGTTGRFGFVSTANSLHGTTANDSVGSGGATALTNGNYVVASPNWDESGSFVNTGAVRFCLGTVTTSGPVTTGNSLTGFFANDAIGSGGVRALTNGNYVVVSPFADLGGTANVGAVTWGNGSTGITGFNNPGNSLMGSVVNDQVGSGGVAALTNGNYVIPSPGWDNGSMVDAGAATWGNGTTGRTGTVSPSNSLVGTQTSDSVGSQGVVALANGNYVVRSAFWDDGATVNAGAATWANGATGLTGAVSRADSIVGPTAFSGLGAVVGHPTNGSFLARFGNSTAATLIVGIPDPADLTYSVAPAATVGVSPARLTTVLNAGTNLVLQASNDITVASPIVVNNPSGNGGTLTLQAGRSIFLNASITTDDGNLNLFANDLLASGVVDAERDPGPAVIDMAPGVTINAGSGNVDVQLRSGAGKTNTQAGDVTLGGITTTGNLSVAAPEGVTDVGPLVIGGTTTLTAGTDIVLDDAGDDFGTVAVFGKNVTLNDVNALVLGASAIGGSLTVRAGGAVSQTGAVTVDGAASIATTGGAAIALNNVSNDFKAAVNLNTDGAASIFDGNALLLGDVTVGGNLTVNTVGALADAGTLAVLGATSLSTGGNAVTLNSAGNNFVGPVTLTGAAALTLVDINGLVLGSSSPTSLNVTAGGPVSETGPLTVSGTTTLNAGSVALDTAANDFVGPVTLNTTGNSALRDANALTLAGSTVGGNLSLSTAGAIMQTGPLTVTGTSSVSAGAGAITLNNAANDFTGSVALTSSASASVRDTNALTIGATSVGGALTAQAGTGLTVAAPLTAQNTVNLTAGTDVSFAAALTTGANAVTLVTGSSSVDLGPIATVSAGGSLTAVNGLTVGNGETLTGAGNVTVGTGAAGLKVLSGGALDPAGTLMVNGDVALSVGSTLVMAVNGISAGQFDVLTVNGGMSLGGATLGLTVGYPPARNDAVTLIANDLSDAVAGSFAQSLITVGGTRWQVSTAAGDGNDVRLTAIEVGLDDILPTLSGVPVSDNIDELTTLQFTATASDPDAGQTLTFSLVDAPVGATLTQTSPTTADFSWTPTEAQGPDTWVFHVRVSDGIASTNASITVVVREINLAPTLSGVPAARTTAPGSPVTFKATATDDDRINGLPNALTFSLVGAPPTASIDPDTGDFTWTPGDFDSVGDYTFMVRVVDDGVPAKSDTKTVTISVKPAAVVNGDLLIGGTAGVDTITINASKDLSQLVVTLNKVVLGSFPLSGPGAVTGRIVAHGLSGNDKITVSSKGLRGADLYGEAGNDALTGGGANDRLFGGSGNDNLKGGLGNDLLVGADGNDVLADTAGLNVLIGGAGVDKLTGGAGDDLLIAGIADASANLLDLTGLNNIMAEWTSGNTYATKVTNLTNGVGAELTKLTVATVHDDGAKDTLTGGKGTDWFLTSANATFPDKTDVKPGETVTTV